VWKTYKLRAAEIADLAHNPQGAIGGEAGVFLRGLDEEERHCEFCLIFVCRVRSTDDSRSVPNGA
jgi:hypothetical protein